VKPTNQRTFALNSMTFIVQLLVARNELFSFALGEKDTFVISFN
jgi:hypothetical protein